MHLFVIQIISGSPYTYIKYRKKQQNSTGILYHRPKCKSSLMEKISIMYNITVLTSIRI